MDLQKPLLKAFALRMFGCVAYTMVTQYYYGYGDTFAYFIGSKIFTEQILKDFNNIHYFFSPMKELGDWYNLNYDDLVFGGYFTQPTGSTVMKISSILSFISFNKILIIGLNRFDSMFGWNQREMISIGSH